MKRYIKKVLICTIVPVFFLLLVTFKLAQLEPLPKIKTDISKAFVGDSHFNSVHDDYIPQSINISSGSESYYYSFYKLKSFLGINPSINHIYLELGFHNSSNYHDPFICGRESFRVLPKFLSILPKEEQIKGINCVIQHEHSLDFFLKVIKNGVLQIIDDEFFPALINEGLPIIIKNSLGVEYGVNPNTGGKVYYEVNTTSINRRLKIQYHNENKIRKFSKSQLYYLSKIVELCEEKDVSLTAINTPLHSYYYKNVPKEYKNKLTEIVNSYKLDYMDLTTGIIDDEYFWEDGHHLIDLAREKFLIKLKEAMHQHAIQRAELK